MVRSILVMFSLLLLLTPLSSGAAERAARKPAPGDKCPVCGMFVAKYPEFTGQLLFKDGTVSFFDGPKDLFKFYLNPAVSPSRRKQLETATLVVTSYYSLTPIDGRTAWYVIGSDVFGPMGRELIPFENEAEAREFKNDHKGKTVLKFSQVTIGLLRGLE